MFESTPDDDLKYQRKRQVRALKFEVTIGAMYPLFYIV